MRLQVALGFRVHSGWASVVAAAGFPSRPVIVERRRIQIADPALAGSKQPYHAAVNAEYPEDLIRRFRDSSNSLGISAIVSLVDELKEKGSTVVGAAVLCAAGRALPDLATILRSHPLLHTAEGEFFREVVASAAEHCSLTLIRIKEREAWDRGTGLFNPPVKDLHEYMSTLGKALGPPWTQDEKLACLAAWFVLAGGHEKKSLLDSAAI